jgi:hypothetical protein
MKFSFHPEAEAEFNDAIDYYEDRERGLGYDFAVEVYATVQRIMAFPKIWPVMKDDFSDVGWAGNLGKPITFSLRYAGHSLMR